MIGHHYMTWLGAPALTYGMLFVSCGWIFNMTRQSFWDGVVYPLAEIPMAAAGAAYYLRRRNVKYFWVVFVVPLVFGLLLAISDVVTAVASGFRMFG